MNIKDKVSIIVPVYNAEKSIQRCIDSILNQTYKNIELILVNDGSTDKSGEICRHYDDSRIKVIHIKNSGVSHARNVGLKEATGTYITFCDADDYYTTNHVKEVLQIAVKQKSDITINAYYAEEDNEFISSTHNKSRKVSPHEVIKHCTLDNEFGGFCWNKLYRAEVIKGLIFPEDVDILEDTYFLFAALSRTENIYYLATPLYYYCDNENSAVRNLSNLYTAQNTLKYNDSWKRILKDFKLNDDDITLIRTAIFRIALECKRMFLKNGELDNSVLKENLDRDIEHFKKRAFFCNEVPLKQKGKWGIKLILAKLN